MIELIDGKVYVGNDADVEEFKDLHPDGAIIHAAKERWHRDAVGYTGRAAPKDDPEYLVAVRGDELMLNLVDAAKPQFIPLECFEAGYDFFADKHLVDELPILIHCNQGKSRGPGLALYCLWKAGFFDECHDVSPDDFDSMIEWFEEEAYSLDDMGDGVYLSLKEWIG